MPKSLSRWLSRLLLPLALAAGSAHAGGMAFPLGPDAKLPHVDEQAWGRLCQRADAITRAISRAAPAASEAQLRCTNLYVKVRLYRYGQVMDAFRSDGAHFPTALQDNSPGHGAFDKLLEEMKRHGCEDDDGGPGGPSGFGSNAFVEDWTRAHPNYSDDAQYGPRILPELGPVQHLVGQVKRAVQARNYPGGAVDEVVEHLLRGQLSGQDVERLGVFLDAAAFYLSAGPSGFVKTAPETARRALPTWAFPAKEEKPKR